MADTPQPDLAGFRRWLEGKRAWAIVGRVEDPETCPLARYLVWATGDPWIVCGPDARYGQPSGEWVEIELPGWADRFTALVDRLPDARPGWALRRAVPAAIALELLTEAEEEERAHA